MILMANDYVGLKITDYLCNNKETIDILVYTEKGEAKYNDEIIAKVRSSCPHAVVYNYNQFRSSLDEIRKQSIRLGILAWWPHILNAEMINVTKDGFINTHPAFLPYNRGKHPYFWSLVEGTPFGVSLHYINEEIDAGRIIAQKLIPYTWNDTGESLYKKAREEMISLFEDNYPMIRDNCVQEIETDWNEGTFHFGKELGPICQIELEKSYRARDLFNILRGRMFNGKGEAFFEDEGIKYRLSIAIEPMEESTKRL